MAAIMRRPLQHAGLEVIPMRRRHIRHVLRIEAQVYPRPWSAALFLSELAQGKTRLYLVAREVGKVVGYGGLMTTGSESHVTTIAVDPDYWGQGIGTRVLLALIMQAIDRGAVSISLEVRRTNERAQSLYRRFGFRPVGIRRGYYIETQEDALIMWVEGTATAEYANRLSRIEASMSDWRP